MLRNPAPKIAPQTFPIPPFSDTPPITAAAMEFMLIVLPIVGLPAQILAVRQSPAIPAAIPANI